MPTAPPPSKQELLQYFQELKSAGRDNRSVLARVAYYGWRLKEVEAWDVLGYEDEDAMREATDIPTSTWYKYTRIGGILRHLSLDDLKAIKTTNLELLTQVPNDLWPEHDWTGEAQSMDANSLCELITRRSRVNGNGREPQVMYRESVPFSSQQMIKSAVKAFQEEHDLASTGRALELMIADQYDRTSYLGSLVKIRRMLAEVREDLTAYMTEKRLLDPVAVALCSKIDDIRIYAGEICAKAIDEARQGKTRKDRRPGQNGFAAESSGSDGVEAPEGDSVAGPAGRVQ